MPNKSVLLHIRNHPHTAADGISTFIEHIGTDLRDFFDTILVYPDDFVDKSTEFSPYSIKAFFKLFSAVCRNKCELTVFAHTFPMILYISIIRALLPKKIKKIIIVEHRSSTNRRITILWPLDFIIYNVADWVVCVSFASKTSLSAWLNKIPIFRRRIEKKCMVIPNGVSRTRTAPRKDYFFRRIVFIGRLHPDKDPGMLIELGRLNIDQIEEILIVGSGFLEHSLKLELRNYTGTPIKFISETSLPFCIIPDDSIVIVPSKTEGFGLVAAEAMINEFPLVCSRIGAFLEITENGSLCWLADASDTESFANAISEIFRNPAETEQKIRLASESIFTKYNWRDTSNCYLKLIREK